MPGRQPTGRKRAPRKCGCNLLDGVFCRHRKDGRIYYSISYRADSKLVQEGSGTNVKEAEALLRQRLREVETGVQVYRGRNGTLEDYASEYFSSCTKKTVEEMRSIYARFISPRFGSRSFDEITSLDFETWVRTIPGSSSTVRNVVSVFRGMLRRAHFEGRASSNFLVSLPRGVLPPLRKKRQQAWKTEEVRRLLLDDVPAPLRILNAIMAYTGMRRGEACGLRWLDLKEDKPLWRLHIERQYDGDTLKGPDGDGAPRVVPVHPQLLGILQVWGPVGSDSNIPIVPNGSIPYTKNAHQKQFARALRNIGVTDATRRTHAFRRHFVTSLRESGVRAEVIRAMTHRGVGLDVLYRYDAVEWHDMCKAVLRLPMGQGIRQPLPISLDDLLMISGLSREQLAEIIR